jgi:hypothetical protein
MQPKYTQPPIQVKPRKKVTNPEINIERFCFLASNTANMAGRTQMMKIRTNTKLPDILIENSFYSENTTCHLTI